MASKAERGLTVAVTGATGDLGSLLIPRLDADPAVERILSLGPRAPLGNKVDHRAIDLTRHDAEEDLVEALGDGKVDALYHLAFLHGRVRNGSVAHEVEVIGTMRVLAAVATAKVPRLVVPSLTALYGARPGQPALLTERAPLEGMPESRFIDDKIQVEEQVRLFRERHPNVRVLVLRFAPVLGPNCDNPATRLLRRRRVPTLLGYDPLWQALHEEDAAEALHRALHADVSGEFNIVSTDVLPFSGMVELAGGRTVPLPIPLARTALQALHVAGVATAPTHLLDYLRYSWVADGRRAQTTLGFSPRRSASEAARSVRV
jgi:UDP-glucose 4-epimerase